MRTALFCVITQILVVIYCRRFGTTYRSHLQRSRGFRREVDENWALLGYYAASSGNFLPTFRDILWVPVNQTSRISNKLPSNIVAVISTLQNFHLLSFIFWNISQRHCIIFYRRFGSLLETSVREYPLTSNIPAHSIIQLQ